MIISFVGVMITLLIADFIIHIVQMKKPHVVDGGDLIALSCRGVLIVWGAAIFVNLWGK